MSRRWVGLALIAAILAGCSGQEPIEQLAEDARNARRRAARESIGRTAQTIPGAPAGQAARPPSTVATTTSSTTTTSTGPPPTRAAEVPRNCTAPNNPNPQSLPAPERALPAVLNGVSMSKQPCFERVVLQFKDGFPATGYKASYEAGPFRARSSGELIPIEGRHFLVVRVEPAKGEGAYDLDGQGKLASDPINPPDGYRAKIHQVRGLAGYGGAVVWVIGMDSRRGFRIGRQDSPPALIIDV